MWWYTSADIPVYIVSGSVVVMNTAYVCHSITYCCAFNVVTSALSLLNCSREACRCPLSIMCNVHLLDSVDKLDHNYCYTLHFVVCIWHVLGNLDVVESQRYDIFCNTCGVS